LMRLTVRRGLESCGDCALRPYDMNGRFKMQGGKNWILPEIDQCNRFFWESHWLEIWSNQFCPSMGLNGGSVATDSEERDDCHAYCTIP
jgi:hypothetical protein